MSKGLHVYYDLMSQPCRAVLIFLRCAEVPFTAHLIRIRKGANRTEEYKAINPLCYVPAIVEDGFPLIESTTILKYVAEKYKVADHWYPLDLRKRMKIDEFLGYYPINLRMTGGLYYREKIILPRLMGKPVDTKMLEMYLSGFLKCLSEMDSYFLRSDNGFLCGSDEISLADVMAACELMQPRASGFDLEKAAGPRLTAWLKRVRDTTEPHFTDIHRILEKERELNMSLQ